MDDELKRYLEAIVERLTERLRDMQTELLGGFEAFSADQVLRSARWRPTNQLNDCAIRARRDSRKEDWRKLS